MNRIDSLFSITTRLQQRGNLRAADLASIYEVSVLAFRLGNGR